MAEHLIVGVTGESIASEYLRKKGYHILAKNIRLGRDEIDLVAFDPRDDVMVFAEVKARRSANPDYWPGMNMTWKKKRSMQRAARKWVARFRFDGGYRMDLLCIAQGRVVDHVEQVEFS